MGDRAQTLSAQAQRASVAATSAAQELQRAARRSNSTAVAAGAASEAAAASSAALTAALVVSNRRASIARVATALAAAEGCSTRTPELECMLCCDVLETPCFLPHCQHTYACRGCLARSANATSACAVCHAPLFPAPELARLTAAGTPHAAAVRRFPELCLMRSVLAGARLALGAESSALSSARLLRFFASHDGESFGAVVARAHELLGAIAGGDVDRCDDEGHSLLWWACHVGHPSPIHALLAMGARTDAAPSPLGEWARKAWAGALSDFHIHATQALVAARLLRRGGAQDVRAAFAGAAPAMQLALLEAAPAVIGEPLLLPDAPERTLLALARALLERVVAADRRAALARAEAQA